MKTTDLPAGTRVATFAGRTGTVIGRISMHNGYKIRWDEPQFNRVSGPAAAVNLYVLDDPALAEQWDAQWPSFVARDRALRRPEVAR